MSTPNTFSVKPYTIRNLAVLYGVAYSTMQAWLKPLREKLGKRTGYYYNVKQVEIIINEIGIPKKINLD